MTRINKLAKIIRCINVPPVLVFSLFIILFAFKRNIFNNVLDLVVSLVCFVFIPILAYPLQKIFDKNSINGRELQRNLAFILSFIGYTLSIIYGLNTHVNRNLLLIYYGYFFSVLALIFTNKLLKLRASGHACSITGSLIYLIYFMGWGFILPCIILFLLIYWASIKLKRHTLNELILGCITAFTSFLLSLAIVSLQI